MLLLHSDEMWLVASGFLVFQVFTHCSLNFMEWIGN